MELKKGDRVKTFGLNLRADEWCSDGTAKLVRPVDDYDPEACIFVRDPNSDGGTAQIEGPFYRWRVRFEDDGQISERWVRESDRI